MNTVKRYAILFTIFIILYVIGSKCLEILESVKIVPFEDIKVDFKENIVQAIFSFLLTFLPLSVLFDFLPSQRLFIILKVISLSCLGLFIGSYIYFITYPEWVEISGADVRKETAMIIFGIVGLIYSLVSSFIIKK